jgi:hypothetical protein
MLACVLFLATLPLGHEPVAGQAANRSGVKSKAWTAPRTPWGHPDLQGLWSNATTTPLERPVEFANKPFLSDEEFAAVNQRVVDRRNTDQAPRAGDPGTYNEFWWERGTLLKQTAIIIEPADGKVPALTPEGRKRADAYSAARKGRGPTDSWEDRNLHERCLLYHGVPPLPTGYNNNYHIVQTRDHVAIRYEMLAETRIIPIDGRPHLGSRIRQWMGDARGRWEGDTLVVESTNFNYAAGGLYELGSVANLQGTGETLRVIERFTRIDADTIDYTFTIDDPTMFTQRWTGRLPLRSFEGPIYEYACHEGNYSMEGMLRGARFEENAKSDEKTLPGGASTTPPR